MQFLWDQDLSAIDKCIEDMKTFFSMQDEGDILDYLGIKVSKLPNGTIKLAQPQLINLILQDLNYAENTKSKLTPAPSLVILQRDLDGAAFDEHWDYWSVISKLNFLEKSTQTGHCLRSPPVCTICSQPTQVPRPCNTAYMPIPLWHTQQGNHSRPKGRRLFGFCWVVIFAVPGTKPLLVWMLWQRNPRSGHVITYAGCPISWSSKMQTKVALSTTEAEYIVCSTALRDVIPLMNLTNKVCQRYDDEIQSQPTVQCKVFEDNSGALELAMTPKMRPRTKHINVKFHHFRDYVKRKLITILPICLEDNPADTLTKPLLLDLFIQHCLTIQGW